MYKKLALKSLSLLSLLLILGLTSVQAQMQKVIPVEYTAGMTNPLMGFRENLTNAKNNYPYVTLTRTYIEYNLLDNGPGDGLQKVIDFTNSKIKDVELYNVKVIPRVILIWDETITHFPSDIPYSLAAWKTEQLKVRVRDLVARLGQAWDKDPRIAFIEVGLIGKWGEQENPVGIDASGVGNDNETWAQILAPAFKNAFPNKKYMVRGMQKWSLDFVAGTYWDSYGAWSKMDAIDDDYPEILRYNNAPIERYKVAPIQGEVAYSMSDPLQMGTNENETVQNANFRKWFIDNIRATHSTTCGIEFDHDNTANDAGSSAIQKAFGYRFLIKEFECSPRTEPGASMSIAAKIVNDGSAPFYENWPLAVVLIDEATKDIVWQGLIPNADITKWYPGSNYDWTPAPSPSFGTGTRQYLTPAAENIITASIPIPANLATGQYLVSLSILDPTTYLPAVFFSVNNFIQKSNTQPLCRVGIGVDPSSFTISSALFDSYNWKNDSRSYNLTYMNSSASSVSVSPATLSLAKYRFSTLTADVLPVYASNKNILWTSNNPAVATVNSYGQVQGQAVGNAVITATTVDGGFQSSCNVTVSDAVACNLPFSTPTFTITSTAKTYSSGVIDVSCYPSVKLAMDVQGTANLENADVLTVSYKLDGVSYTLLNKANDLALQSLKQSNIHANTLEIIITGTQDAADEIYTITNLKLEAEVVKDMQFITFPAIATKAASDADFSPAATASSGLAVSYSSSNTAVATIVSGKIHIVGSGIAYITASQAGDASYNAATPVVQKLTVITPCIFPTTKPNFTITSTSNAYSSGIIDIACTSSVTISGTLAESSSFEASDTLKVLYKVDGVLHSVASLVNDFTSYTLNAPLISGSTLEIIIQGTQDAVDEIYAINGLTITSNGPATAIENNEVSNGIKAYPNPVRDNLIIEHPENATIRIYNTLGTLLYTTHSVGVKTSIARADLQADGLVLVQVVSGNVTAVSKVSLLK